MAIHVTFIFQSLFLTGQENDSTKKEVKLEAESQSSCMETEGTETRIYCYLRTRWRCVVTSVYTGVCEQGACVLLGSDSWRVALVLSLCDRWNLEGKKEL